MPPMSKPSSKKNVIGPMMVNSTMVEPRRFLDVLSCMPLASVTYWGVIGTIRIRTVRARSVVLGTPGKFVSDANVQETATSMYAFPCWSVPLVEVTVGRGVMLVASAKAAWLMLVYGDCEGANGSLP